MGHWVVYSSIVTSQSHIIKGITALSVWYLLLKYTEGLLLILPICPNSFFSPCAEYSSSFYVVLCPRRKFQFVFVHYIQKFFWKTWGITLGHKTRNLGTTLFLLLLWVMFVFLPCTFPLKALSKLLVFVKILKKQVLDVVLVLCVFIALRSLKRLRNKFLEIFFGREWKIRW